MMKKIKRIVMGVLIIIFWLFVIIGYNGEWIMKLTKGH